MRSRVIPGSLVTIERRVPVSRLKIVDFPTFGRPTITTDGSFSVIFLAGSKWSPYPFSVIGGHNEPYARGSEASTVSYRTPKQKLRGFHANRPLFARPADRSQKSCRHKIGGYLVRLEQRK